MDQDNVTYSFENKGPGEAASTPETKETQNELEEAREILDGMGPKYLALKARFISSRHNGPGGLVLMIAEKGVENYLFVGAVIDNNLEWVNSISVKIDPLEFFHIVKNYLAGQIASFHVYDAQKLRDDISSRMSVSGLNYILESADSLQLDSSDEVDSIESTDKADSIESNEEPGNILLESMTNILGEILNDKFEVVLDYDLMTEDEFAGLSESLGLSTPEEEEPVQTDSGKTAKLLDSEICLKGRFNIDPVGGILVHELEVGDTVFCDILDRNEMAVRICHAIGAYKKGLWKPMKGRITEINEIEDRLVFKLIVGKKIYVMVSSYKNLKVKCSNLAYHNRVLTQQEDSIRVGMFPILIAVVLLAILIFILQSMN